MPSITYSAAIFGIEARLVTVEADAQRGIHSMVTVVGLPDAAVQEAKERIRSAIKNNGFEFPYGRVTFNLSPAGWRKEGSGFDLPAALALLVSTGQLPELLNDYVIVGELSLSGQVQPILGAVAIAQLAKQLGKKLILPEQNAPEAAAINNVEVFPVSHMAQITTWMSGGNSLLKFRSSNPSRKIENTSWSIWPAIRGQNQAKRAMTIAAVGRHNVLLVGPPGSGKTMLAQGLQELLPPLSIEESIMVTKIHSVAGKMPAGISLLSTRPFRQPHHTSSVAALVGGGRMPKPGELSLAHLGILFLDEFAEFSRDHIEALRQPLEDGVVTVSRVAGTERFPAGGMLVAAMNPCPCGWLHDPDRTCQCNPAAIYRYHRRISGPILDRFDLYITVPRVPARELSSNNFGSDPRPLIQSAKNFQSSRRIRLTNSQLRGDELLKLCRLGSTEQEFIQLAMERLQFSMRAYHRLLRVSRSIADLDQQEKISTAHIAEALQFRPPATLQ